jgi:hypothetical protein
MNLSAPGQGTVVVRISAELLEKVLKAGAVVDARCVEGLPDDAKLIEAFFNATFREAVLTFATRQGLEGESRLIRPKFDKPLVQARGLDV